MPDKEKSMELNKKQSWSLLPVIYFFLCFCVSLAGVWIADYRLLTVDNATILVFAKEMLNGRPLYSDLFTSQFPFIFYLSMIPLWMHSLMGIPIPTAFFLFVFLLLQICVLFSWRIARKNPYYSTTGQRYVLLLAFYYGLFILPIASYVNNFGQREHLFCALILPYVMLAVNRLQGIKSDTRAEEFAAGFLGAVGFCIKPHFALILVVSELFQMLARRKFFVWNRPDVWVIAVLCGIYYLSCLGLISEYIGLIPRFVTNYSGYENPLGQILGYALLVAIVPVVFAYYMRRAVMPSLLLYILAMVACGVVLYIIPKLPYYYHAIPAYFFSLLLFVLALLAAQKTARAFMVILLFTHYIFLANGVPEPDIMRAQREEMLHEASVLAPYKRIVSLNTEARIHSVISYTDARWDMGLAYLEYLPASYRKWRDTESEPPYRTPEEMGEHERFFHEKLIKDLQHLPDAIIVDESPVKCRLNGMKFDYLNYLMLDPSFRDIWKHYELVTRFSRSYETSRRSINSDAALYRRKD